MGWDNPTPYDLLYIYVTVIKTFANKCDIVVVEDKEGILLFVLCNCFVPILSNLSFVKIKFVSFKVHKCPIWCLLLYIFLFFGHMSV